MKSLEGHTLLIITDRYPHSGDYLSSSFVKNQVEQLKCHFKKVYVISLTPYVPKLFSHLPFVNPRWKRDVLAQDYEYENVQVFFARYFTLPIPFARMRKGDASLKAAKRLIIHKGIKFDLIHAHFTWPSGYVGVRLKEEYGKPVITTIHENGDWFDQEVEMNHPLINTAWSGADALIRVNRKDVPVLKRYNERVYSIPNGFSPAFHPIDTVIARDRLGLPGNAKVIFTLGNLNKRKGFNYLIDAMEHICSQRDDVLCFIGGAGLERGSLQGQIDRLRLGEKVKLLGSVPGDQLTLWMNACDIFVLPSLSESFGIVQLEALACGKPVVATRNGGSEEVIISDEYGLLADPADPEDLAEKILVALDRKWDGEAILRYAEQFTWENIAQQIIEVYYEVSEGFNKR